MSKYGFRTTCTKTPIDVGPDWELAGLDDKIESGYGFQLKNDPRWITIDNIDILGIGKKVSSFLDSFCSVVAIRKPKKNPFIENYSYILIDTDEKRKQFYPKLQSDEYLDAGKWNKFNDSLFRPYFLNAFVYRRPVVPEWGYELIGLDEIVPRNNVRVFGNGSWGSFYGYFDSSKNFACDAKLTVREFFKHYPKMQALTRPKNNPGGWIDVKDRLPDSGRFVPVKIDNWARISTGYIFTNGVWLLCEDEKACAFDKVTHWFDIPNVP